MGWEYKTINDYCKDHFGYIWEASYNLIPEPGIYFKYGENRDICLLKLEGEVVDLDQDTLDIRPSENPVFVWGLPISDKFYFWDVPGEKPNITPIQYKQGK